MSIPIPKYTESSGVKLALQRIKHPPNDKHYEHYVSTWAGSMLKSVFSDEKYTLSTEVIDPHEKSRPDFLIERLEEVFYPKDNKKEEKLVRHVYVELKRVQGDHFFKALHQATKHIRKTIEEGSEVTKECFVVVQRGLDIGFFEYHSRQDDLEEIGIPNFEGCVSLTQSFHTDEDMPYTKEDLKEHGHGFDPAKILKGPMIGKVQFKDNQRIILPGVDLLSDLKVLSFGNYQGKDKELNRIKKEADKYTIPCVFNIEKHADAINHLFCYMACQEPRIIITDP